VITHEPVRHRCHQCDTLEDDVASTPHTAKRESQLHQPNYIITRHIRLDHTVVKCYQGAVLPAVLLSPALPPLRQQHCLMTPQRPAAAAVADTAAVPAAARSTAGAAAAAAKVAPAAAAAADSPQRVHLLLLLLLVRQPPGLPGEQPLPEQQQSLAALHSTAALQQTAAAAEVAGPCHPSLSSLSAV
jgi:hypothetical protein